jgi:hypothetical protein
VAALQGGKEMNLLNLVIAKTHKTAYQLFYIAYSGEDKADSYIQWVYGLYERHIIISPFMENFLRDILEGRREV